MKFNTHSQTPKPKSSKLIKVLFSISLILMYIIPLMGIYCCFYYAKSIVGGILLIVLTITLTAICVIMGLDIEKAYVEFSENDICVVDYYFLIKKEKHFKFQDIAKLEITYSGSYKLHGYRLNIVGFRYIVFRDAKSKYLFKILYTEENYEQLKKILNKNFTSPDNWY